MYMIIALFAGAIFATHSRSGVAILLLLALAAPAYIYFNINPKKLAVGSAVFYGIIIFVFAKSHVVLSALNRFDKANDDGRYNIWAPLSTSRSEPVWCLRADQALPLPV